MRDVDTIIPPAFEIVDQVKDLRARATAARGRAQRELDLAEELDSVADVLESADALEIEAAL
jgi:hypothetical protein